MTATYKTMMVMNVTIDYITKGVLVVACGGSPVVSQRGRWAHQPLARRLVGPTVVSQRGRWTHQPPARVPWFRTFALNGGNWNYPPAVS